MKLPHLLLSSLFLSAGSSVVASTAEPLLGVSVPIPNMVDGLSGNADLAAFKLQVTSPIIIMVRSGDKTYSGDLSSYSGTMFVSSAYGSKQIFSGVKGNENWKLTTTSSGHVEFNLMGDGSNALTMGVLDMLSGAKLTILMDVTDSASTTCGISLKKLAIAEGSKVNIGHHSGTVTLGGAVGSAYSLSIFRADSKTDIELEDKITWNIQGIRNLDQMEIKQENGAVLLTGVITAGTPYVRITDNINSAAAANWLWSLNNTVSYGGDLSAVDSAVLELLPKAEANASQAAEMNRILAAVAGSSIATLSLALDADMDRQLRTMRNRTTSMGSSEPTQESRLSLWLNAETAYYKQDSDGFLPGIKTNGWGGTLGMNLDRSGGTTVGLALTAMYNDLETDAADSLSGDMDTYYLSGLVQMHEGAWSHTFVCSIGTSALEVRRAVNYGDGSYTTTGSTDGLSFGLLYELGYAIVMNSEASFILQPIANISWRYNRLNAYTETGSNAALSVDEQTLNRVTLAVGARVQSLIGEHTWNHPAILEARALLKGHLGDRKGEAEVALAHPASQRATVQSSESGALGVELGIGIIIPLSASGDIFADLSAELGDKHTNVNATLGYKISF